MKKLLYIIMTLLLFTSCEEYNKQAEEAQKIHIQRIQNEKEKLLTPDTTDCVWNMQNVKFDGHLYVVYTERFGVAMVHSPNCECNKEINK